MENNYKLHIDGLDEKMEDGVPNKHIILLAGTPGTMKSTVAYHFLNENTKQNDTKGLYLTLEQDKDNFMYHINKLGIGEPAENLYLYDLTTTREQWLKLDKSQAEKVDDANVSTKDLETLKRQIETLKGAIGFDLLVIDSLPVLEMMFKMDDPRDELFHFFKWLKKLCVTTVLVTEMSQDSPKYSKHDVDFLADGIIKVSMIPIGPTKTARHIQVVKMRGVNHSTDPFELRYSNNRFEALKVIM
ncbi:MAG: AAA family ATPase [Thermoplasmata archaeon]|nr:AAA family ATPase [Thermoplasmata archaeon]MCK5396920.1 AAA family ATPase [Thermoplasmata archaeon]